MKQLRPDKIEALYKSIDILWHNLTEAGQNNYVDYLVGQYEMLELIQHTCIHLDGDTVDMDKLKDCYDSQMLRIMGTAEFNHQDIMSKVCKGTATSDEARALGIHIIMERHTDSSEHGLTEDNNRLEELDMNAILKHTMYLRTSMESPDAKRTTPLHTRLHTWMFSPNPDDKDFIRGQLAVYDKALLGGFNKPDSSLFDRDATSEAFDDMPSLGTIDNASSKSFVLGQHEALHTILHEDGLCMKLNPELDHLIQSHKLDTLGDILPHMSDKAITDVFQSLPDCTIEYHSTTMDDLGTALDGLSTEKDLEL